LVGFLLILLVFLTTICVSANLLINTFFQFHFHHIHIKEIREKIDDYEVDDFEIQNYRCHAAIKVDMVP
jgi:thymidylate synthase